MAHQSWIQKSSGWLVSHKAQLFQFGWPLALFETFNAVYDKGFIPAALWIWGPLWGALIPTVLALLINAFVYWLYDYMKVDWLRARALRELANQDNQTQFQKILTWHLKPKVTFKERVIGEIRFAALLAVVDPVIVATYYRENHFGGVSARDWFMLVKATLVAITVWIVMLQPVVLVLKLVVYGILYAWNFVF